MHTAIIALQRQEDAAATVLYSSIPVITASCDLASLALASSQFCRRVRDMTIDAKTGIGAKPYTGQD